MNLLFRLFLVAVFAPFRERINLFDLCRTGFRVALTDLDILRHMNNGKYGSLMDVARTDYLFRTGMFKTLKKHGWYPVVVSEHFRFRRSLELGDPFEIQTRLLGWDDRHFFIEQHFVRSGEIAAIGLVRGRFLSRKGDRVAPQQLVNAMGNTLDSPPLSAYVLQWKEADDSLYSHHIRK